MQDHKQQTRITATSSTVLHPAPSSGYADTKKDGSASQGRYHIGGCRRASIGTVAASRRERGGAPTARVL